VLVSISAHAFTTPPPPLYTYKLPSVRSYSTALNRFYRSIGLRHFSSRESTQNIFAHFFHFFCFVEDNMYSVGHKKKGDGLILLRSKYLQHDFSKKMKFLEPFIIFFTLGSNSSMIVYYLFKYTVLYLSNGVP
jgi:hypothetical protein